MSPFAGLAPVSLAVTAAALFGAYSYARRRSNYQPRDTSNERTDRIWHPATLFSLATTIPMMIGLVLRGAVIEAVITGFLALTIIGACALLYAMLFDLAVTRPLRANRTWRWMILGPALFALPPALLLLAALAYILSRGGVIAPWEELAIIGNAMAAGLWWWAYLPLDEDELPRVFR